jgi:hypothetical protein
MRIPIAVLKNSPLALAGDSPPCAVIGISCDSETWNLVRGVILAVIVSIHLISKLDVM